MGPFIVLASGTSQISFILQERWHFRTDSFSLKLCTNCDKWERQACPPGGALQARMNCTKLTRDMWQEREVWELIPTSLPYPLNKRFHGNHGRAMKERNVLSPGLSLWYTPELTPSSRPEVKKHWLASPLWPRDLVTSLPLSWDYTWKLEVCENQSLGFLVWLGLVLLLGKLLKMNHHLADCKVWFYPGGMLTKLWQTVVRGQKEVD